MGSDTDAVALVKAGVAEAGAAGNGWTCNATRWSISIPFVKVLDKRPSVFRGNDANRDCAPDPADT